MEDEYTCPIDSSDEDFIHCGGKESKPFNPKDFGGSSLKKNPLAATSKLKEKNVAKKASSLPAKVISRTKSKKRSAQTVENEPSEEPSEEPSSRTSTETVRGLSQSTRTVRGSSKPAKTVRGLSKPTRTVKDQSELTKTVGYLAKPAKTVRGSSESTKSRPSPSTNEFEVTPEEEESFEEEYVPSIFQQVGLTGTPTQEVVIFIFGYTFEGKQVLLIILPEDVDRVKWQQFEEVALYAIVPGPVDDHKQIYESIPGEEINVEDIYEAVEGYETL